jgi:heme-degrading monooxygenase HmoA
MTHVRMSCWTSKPGMDSESLRLWTEGVLDVWRAQPGLVQVHLLSRRGTDQRMTFSVWRSSQDYEAFARSDALRDVAAAFDHVYTDGGRPVAAVWAVLTDDWPTSG